METLNNNNILDQYHNTWNKFQNTYSLLLNYTGNNKEIVDKLQENAERQSIKLDEMMNRIGFTPLK